MRADWQVGDAAICVRADWNVGEDCAQHAGHLYSLMGPRVGSEWLVRDVADFDLSLLGGGETGVRAYLMLRGQPDVWFSSDRFRKAQRPPPIEIERRESVDA